MDDQIGLNGPDSPADREAEVRGPRHPVLSRKHCARPCFDCAGSRSERAATLATPAGHDGTTSPRAHAQTEAVHACATPVVRLKCPLALGHGCISSIEPCVRADTPMNTSWRCR